MNIIAVPYKFYNQVNFIVDYLRNNFNIKLFNRAELSLIDNEGNKYYLFNDPNKVRGFQFKGMVFDPQFEYDVDLIDTIKTRIRL